MNKKSLALILSASVFMVTALVSLVGCSRDSSSSDPEEPVEDPYYTTGRQVMDDIFHYYYWWCDEVPDNVPWNQDFFQYFDDYLVAQDRWSWMETGDEWRDSQSGTVSGSMGAVYAQPIEQGDYDIYVEFVLLNSPMYNAGVRRGWRMDKIGEYSVRDLITSEAGIEILYQELSKTTNTYYFVDGSSQSHEVTVTADIITTPTYLDRRVFTPEDFPGLNHNVGYFNYRTFVSTLTSDITTTFDMFRSAGVKDLILDLRYNGGGSTDALDVMVGLTAPKSLDGDVFSILTHNKYLSKMNETCYYNIADGTLSLDRIFVITGRGTASASEVLINGLRDGLGKNHVITVGDTTYGKPNGMYALAYPEGSSRDYYGSADYVFLPICFYTCNKSGEQIPDAGFPPMRLESDDLYHDWGTEEKLIKECLTYIVTGFFPPKMKSSACGRDTGTGQGCRMALPQDAPGYGRLIKEHPETAGLSASSLEELRNE